MMQDEDMSQCYSQVLTSCSRAVYDAASSSTGLELEFFLMRLKIPHQLEQPQQNESLSLDLFKV